MKKKLSGTVVVTPLFFLGLLLFVNIFVFSQAKGVGIFDGQTDIGQVIQPGVAMYDTETDEYEILSPATNNGLLNQDPIHFVWKQIKGDFIIYAQVNLLARDTNLSTRLGCMIRTNLDANSPNISASIDEKGETSIEYVKDPDDSINEVRYALKNANVIQLQRDGNDYIIRVAKFGEPFITRQVTNLNLGDDVFVGLFIGSINQDKVEKGIYNNIRLTIPVPKILSIYRTDIGSNLEILDIETGNRKIVYSDTSSIHAPIWQKDGNTLIYGKQGLLYTFDLVRKKCTLLNTAGMKNNSNDHVLSCDGKMLGICIRPTETEAPIMYTVPASGGHPKRISKKGPSFPHCWSLDGKMLLFAGSREGEFEIYKISARGGKEYRITNTRGMDDCPEYSPDGKYIYFSSNRTGSMHIWRMKPDGSDQEMVTAGGFYDWFPHVSPNGKWIVFLSYSKDDASPSGHPSYRQVYLRLMPVSGGEPKIIAYVYGGQGTINSPCWSPDSKKIAFASYSDTQY
ncbi:TolB family protein [Segetibacter koreensis]|uniref:TolB family protein n=1 Tax=Segetibacter koreensis TaxID=398037 RepID=UPI00035D75E5|nr:TolB family protein [Segetibacter koreensis]